MAPKPLPLADIRRLIEEIAKPAQPQEERVKAEWKPAVISDVLARLRGEPYDYNLGADLAAYERDLAELNARFARRFSEKLDRLDYLAKKQEEKIAADLAEHPDCEITLEFAQNDRAVLQPFADLVSKVRRALKRRKDLLQP